MITSDSQEFPNSNQNEKPVVWRQNWKPSKEAYFCLISSFFLMFFVWWKWKLPLMSSVQEIEISAKFHPFFFLSFLLSVLPSFNFFHWYREQHSGPLCDQMLQRHMWERKEQVKQSPTKWRSRSSEPAVRDWREMRQ